MANRRPEMHRLQDLVRLHRQRTGARETACLLAMSPNTERQYREALAQAGLLDGDPAALPSWSGSRRRWSQHTRRRRCHRSRRRRWRNTGW